MAANIQRSSSLRCSVAPGCGYLIWLFERNTSLCARMDAQARTFSLRDDSQIQRGVGSTECGAQRRISTRNAPLLADRFRGMPTGTGCPAQNSYRYRDAGKRRVTMSPGNGHAGRRLASNERAKDPRSSVARSQIHGGALQFQRVAIISFGCSRNALSLGRCMSLMANRVTAPTL
jgi:hypothetical protein